MRTLAKSVVVCVFALAAVSDVPAAAAAPARQMYESAMAREKALRAAWDAQSTNVRGVSSATVKEARAIVSAYEAVVRTHRTSGYCDNALWQAATLAADLFARSGQTVDRRSAGRLFEFLAREYPASPLAAKAADQARRLPSSPAAPATPPPSVRAASIPEESPPPAREAPAATITRPVALVREIRRSVLTEVVRVSIELDREVIFHEERVENPARLLFDLPSTRPAPALQDANWNYQDDVVRHIRVGRHPNQTTRVVLDLDGVSRYTVVTLYNPYRILIDCERAAVQPITRPGTAGAARPAAPSADVAPTQRATPKTDKVDPNRDDTPPAETTRKPAAAKSTASEKTADKPSERNAERIPDRSEDKEPARAAEKPARSAERPADKTPGKTAPDAPAAGTDRNRFSMARQLGLGVSRIVIDPGHGGHDPGADGPGMSEADIVLDIALRLEKALKKQPGVEVALTRRTDVFIPLEERTAIANREQADLFLSIHANASRNLNARGVESYYLNFASNPDAEAVAARENAASERTMNSLTDMVKAIALNNKLEESKDFAGLVQEAMARRLRASNKSLRDLGVKKAPFVVLIGASMPSVLAEVSFLTNKREGQLLRTDAYRQRIAEALADAILRYKRGLKPTKVVAHGTDDQ